MFLLTVLQNCIYCVQYIQYTVASNEEMKQSKPQEALYQIIYNKSQNE